MERQNPRDLSPAGLQRSPAAAGNEQAGDRPPASNRYTPDTLPSSIRTSAVRMAALDDALVQLRAAVADLAGPGGGRANTRDIHAAAAHGTAGSGGQLPFLPQIQRSFGGHDVGGVKAHVGQAAREAGELMGAEAYASGDHVAFRGAPDLHTAAHEAAHVVQQRAGVQLAGGVGSVGDRFEQHADAVADRVVRGESAQELLDAQAGPAPGGAVQLQAGGKAVQLLIRDTYPWTGVVIDAWSIALRSSPNKDQADPHANTVADLPKGTSVRVIARSGNWLQVEVELDGRNLTGYVSQELIDEATANQMESMLGEQAAWTPSGPGSGNTFESWASAATEAEAPPLGSSTTINCWEMILYAAYQAGAIDWNWIHDLYVNQPMSTWVSRMTSAGTQAYDPNTSTLTRGDLVFFDGLAHVSLATGNGDEIYTFWPPPNTPFSTGTGGTVDEVKTSTIHELSAWMNANFGTAPTVTFGAPAW